MKNEVIFDSRRQSGNIFWILGAAAGVLTKEKAEEMCNRVYACGSYENALEIVREYVDLIDMRGEK